MSLRNILELIIKQETTGDGISKVAAELGTAKGGLTDFEKTVMGTRSTIGGLDRDIIAFNTNLGSSADLMSGLGVSIPTSPMMLFGQMLRQGTELMWESTQMAGDAREEYSLFNQVFREESEGTREELSAFGDDVGRSGRELEAMASKIQAVLVPMGATRSVAADWSVTMTQVATDLAAAWNAADADVLDNIQSAMMGSVLTMRKYGIDLKATAVEQELLNMGVEGGIENASEYQKVLARMNAIVAATADIQGQAARESDGFNGQMKELTANANDLKVALGEALLPAANTLISALNNGNRTIDVSRRFWDALEDALRLGVITQEEYNEMGREYQRIAREGNAITEESIAQTEALEEAVQNAAFTQAGYGGMIAEDIAHLQDYGMELDGVRGETEGVTEATLDAAAAEQEYQDAMSDLNALMNGKMGPATERFTEQQAELAGKIGEVEEEIADLESRSYLTGAQRQNLEDLYGKLDELQGKSGELTDQYEEDSKRRQFAILEEQAIAAGVYDAEWFDSLAREWGLIDEETANYTDAAALYFEQWKDEGTVALSTLDELGLTLDSLPLELQGKIIYDVVINGSVPGAQAIPRNVTNVWNWQAEGGVLLPGQGAIVGELGPEPVIATQPATVVSNRDWQNSGKSIGGVTIVMQGPVYMRTEREIRDVLERIMVDAARG